MTHPTFREISRARDGRARDETVRHVAACVDCAARLRRLEDLARAARAAEVAAPSRAWVRRTESTLRERARPVDRARLSWLATAAGAAGLAFAAGLLLTPSPPPSPAVFTSAGTAMRHVTLHPTADGEPTIERFELVSGDVSLAVPHLSAARRLIVATSDGEVEVRGTRFLVSAAGGSLRRVEVAEGLVEVRRAGDAPLLVPGGSTWRAPPRAPAPAAIAEAGARPVAVPPPPSPRVRAGPPAVAPPRAPAPDPAAPPEATPSAEAAFVAGWDALQAGNPGRAADRFASAADLAGADAIGEDAAYWRVVALQRLGSADVAEREAREFLDRHADSPRAGELALVAAAGRLSIGDSAAARRYLDVALRDRSPEVRARARELSERVAAGAPLR